MPSEVWMDPAAAGRILAEGHFLNTTIGVWFYESDTWDKQTLRKKLLALVDHVTSPTFMPDYEEWGRRQIDPRTEKLRLVECGKCGARRIAAIPLGGSCDCQKCGGKGTAQAAPLPKPLGGPREPRREAGKTAPTTSSKAAGAKTKKRSRK
jgi:hypothetical protein